MKGLKEHFLLKNEELKLFEIDEMNGIIDIPIIKRTARTRRKVAILTLGMDHTNEIPSELIKSFTSPKVKKQLTLSDQTFDWIRHGWVIREYRLEKDERTVMSEQYRMGYVLFQHIKRIENQRSMENKELLLDWYTNWRNLNPSIKSTDMLRSNLLQILANKLEGIADESQQFVKDNIDRFERVNSTWRFKKQLLFLHFLLALYEIALCENPFDWKQIGARYYRKIGGSKQLRIKKSSLRRQSD
ncbi:hypothetical protein [Halalkalibacter urbisdiaboli]|uniref:hypothetical protein n=1 Tax=Halalkalibacter urbisdiaboli TaxID=1960589 RepID=UPI000B43D73E|nr:hypothetical protein [Halalkalibacter urbisdiaboli]